VKQGYNVHISYKSIQRFLFSSYQLRDMVGANVVLGEVLRDQLVDMTISHFSDDLQPLPLDNFNSKNELDPLSELPGLKVHLYDDLNWLGQRGIQSREGGHTIVWFISEAAALKYIDAVRSWLQNNLPEIGFSISLNGEVIEDITPVHHSIPIWLQTDQVTRITAANLNPQLPSEDVSVAIHKNQFVSQNTIEKRRAAQRFFDEHSKTTDIVGLLHKNLIPPNLITSRYPYEIQHMCQDSDLLAVIHADGNDIGMHFSNYRKSLSNNPIESAMSEESFFYHMRIAARYALQHAIKNTFDAALETEFLPYQILMAGGDDLLIVADAIYAFDFTVHYNEGLKDYFNQNIHSTDASRIPYSIGVGIAISHANMPFHNLHSLAEDLAGNAKKWRKERALPQGASVVDWHFATQSAHSQISQTRASLTKSYHLAQNAMPLGLLEDGVNELNSYTLQLTQKPFVISSNDSDEESGVFALDKLLLQAKELANEIKEQQAARSQARQFLHELNKGYFQSILAENKLPDYLKKLDWGKLWREELYAKNDGTKGDVFNFSTLYADRTELAELFLKPKKES